MTEYEEKNEKEQVEKQAESADSVQKDSSKANKTKTAETENGTAQNEKEKGEQVKLEDFSIEELRQFVMFQKTITDALTKEKDQLIKEKQDLAKVISNSDKYLDQLVAIKNDFNSYKERIRSDADRSRDEGKVCALEKILPLLDTLEKARVSIADGKAFELIYRQFTRALFEIGAEEIEVLNLPFGPKVANAVTNREVEEEQKGKVVEVYQKGYKFKDKILRYAQVIVGK